MECLLGGLVLNIQIFTELTPVLFSGVLVYDFAPCQTLLVRLTHHGFSLKHLLEMLLYLSRNEDVIKTKVISQGHDTLIGSCQTAQINGQFRCFSAHFHHISLELPNQHSSMLGKMCDFLNKFIPSIK